MATRITASQVAEQVATLSSQVATLTDIVAKLAQAHMAQAQASPAPKARAAAPAAAQADRKAGLATREDGGFVTGPLTDQRCPHVRVKADGTTRQCRQHVDAEGVCRWHGRTGLGTHSVIDATTSTAKPKARAAAPAAPKAPAEGGPYEYGAATCKGHKANGDDCGARFLNAAGYCRNHHGQARKARTVRAK